MSPKPHAGSIAGRAIALIEAPSNLGLMPLLPGGEPGTRKAPEALRRAGLHAALAPAVIARVEAAPYDPDEAHKTQIRNVAAIADHAVRLANEIGAQLEADRFPLVIGGDCSILLGAALALRRRGAYGLLYIDGHTDFYLPEQSATGGAAGMDLAFVTGFGPDALADLEGLRPYFRTGDVAAIGNRDGEIRPGPLPPAAEAMGAYADLATLRREPIAAVLRRAFAAIDLASLDGIWIHCDVDVLDGEIMPAVDSPQPDGLSYAELAEVLQTALATGKVAGCQLTIFDPDLDPDGTIAARLAAELAQAVLD